MSSPLRPANAYAPPVVQGGQKAVAHGQATTDKVEIILPANYVDRRAEPRENCDGRGALLLLSLGVTVQCRIMDQSPSGARIAFDGIGNIPTEIWLIDLDSNMVRRGTSAWSTPTRMGLKFNFVQTLVPSQPRPAKVPQEVYDTWLRLTDRAPVADVKKPDTPPEAPDDVLYFD